MNKQRRKQIGDLIGKLEEIASEVDMLSEEEQQCADDMPENLWGSERHESMEEKAQQLQDAAQEIRGAMDSLNEVTEL